MRKIIISEMVSLDGYYADVTGGIDWHLVNDQFNQYAIKLLKNVDTILFGRITYQLFEGFWPQAATDPNTSPDDLTIANAINNIKKVVVSSTLERVTWNNSELIKDINLEEITAMKESPGKDIVIYGSGTVVRKLQELHLIDDYRLFVVPILLGGGKRLFGEMDHQHTLTFHESMTMDNGVVLLRYTQN